MQNFWNVWRCRTPLLELMGHSAQGLIIQVYAVLKAMAVE
jgi:hypothetical protein